MPSAQIKALLNFLYQIHLQLPQASQSLPVSLIISIVGTALPQILTKLDSIISSTTKLNTLGLNILGLVLATLKVLLSIELALLKATSGGSTGVVLYIIVAMCAYVLAIIHALIDVIVSVQSGVYTMLKNNF